MTRPERLLPADAMTQETVSFAAAADEGAVAGQPGRLRMVGATGAEPAGAGVVPAPGTEPGPGTEAEPGDVPEPEPGDVPEFPAAPPQDAQPQDAQPQDPQPQDAQRPTQIVEATLTFSVHGRFRLPAMAGDATGVAQAMPRPSGTVRTSYVDSSDLRLARSGVSLVHRAGPGRAGPTEDKATPAEPPGWVLSLPAFPDPSEMNVLSAPGGVAAVPATLRELVTSWLRGAPLEVVATLRTVRAGIALLGGSGETLAELCDETVSVLDGRNVLARFRELHLRSQRLTPAGLDEIVRRLSEAGAVEGEFLPRLVRALGTRALAPADVPKPSPVGTGDPAGGAVSAAVRRSVRRLQHADSAVRLRLPDGVHQMRVACRRLRSDLRTFGPLVQREWADGLRTELSWLAESLGAARDIEVLRDRFRQDADASAAYDPLPLDPAALARIDSLLAAQEVRALRAADVALRSQRYLDLLDALVSAAREPQLSAAAAEPCSAALPPLVSTAWGRLGKHARRLRPDGADETWHSARIVAKRARYAAEAVAPVLGRRARRMAHVATSVQEVLGEHQDAAIAAQTVHDLARAHPRDGALALVAGRLVERERGRVAASRAAFPRLWREAARARGAWRR